MKLECANDETRSKISCGQFWGFVIPSSLDIQHSSLIILTGNNKPEKVRLRFPLEQMDQTLFHLINERWTSPALDLFMGAISDVAIWKPLLIVFVLAALVVGRFKTRACIFCLLLSLFITQQVTTFLKTAINRHRPKHVQSVRMVYLQSV